MKILRHNTYNNPWRLSARVWHRFQCLEDSHIQHKCLKERTSAAVELIVCTRMNTKGPAYRMGVYGQVTRLEVRTVRTDSTRDITGLLVSKAADVTVDMI